MSENFINATHTILKGFDALSGSLIQTIYAPKPVQVSGITAPYYSAFLQSLRVFIKLPSMNPASFPNLEPELTRTQGYQEIKRVETTSDSKILNLYMKTGSFDWFKIAEATLLRYDPSHMINLLPYVTSNADFAMGEDVHLGVNITASNTGLLKTGDSVVVMGSVVLQAFYKPSISTKPITGLTNTTHTVTGEKIVLFENYFRLYLSISLQTDSKVWINFSEGQTNTGILLTGIGANYEMSTYSVYQGKIFLYCEDTAIVNIIEGTD